MIKVVVAYKLSKFNTVKLWPIICGNSLRKAISSHVWFELVDYC